MTPQQLLLTYSRLALPFLGACTLVLTSGLVTQKVRAETAPVVAAAASLRYALDDVAAAFQQETGKRVRLTYGATRSLMHQIENGAPFELFLAADAESTQWLAKNRRTESEPAAFAHGRLALVVPKGSSVSVDGELSGLADAFVGGKVTHVAIANPEIAPYGRAAQEALQKAGLWEDLATRLVRGENIGQAAQFATTGAVQAGLIAHSLALHSDVAARVRVALISEDWHGPIVHTMALLKGAGDTARTFAAFLKSEQARAILKRNGFAAPQP